MPPISGSAEGPVAVTGASGYIGAHVVKNLVEHGYEVHACLRDASREDKTAYLHEIDERGPGGVKLFSCDLFKAGEGDYDEAFRGCSAVFHVAADIGTDATYGRPSPEKQYRGLVDSTIGILESCRKAGTVRRVVYTSSAAAVMGPTGDDRADGHIYDENDWSGGDYETLEQRHTGPDGVTNWTVTGRSYAKGKVDAERAGYEFGDATGIDVISVCPVHVLGPLLGVPHDTVWQHRLSLMLKGQSGVERQGNHIWNIIDVRDIGETQRLIIESSVAANGSRYLMSATDESGEPTGLEMMELLAELFPKHNICGGYRKEPTDRRLRGRCTKAIEELGLVTHGVTDTLRDTGDSLIRLGIVPPQVD